MQFLSIDKLKNIYKYSIWGYYFEKRSKSNRSFGLDSSDVRRAEY